VIFVEIDGSEISHVLEGVLVQHEDHVVVEIDLDNTVKIVKSALVKIMEPPISERDYTQILQLLQYLTGHEFELARSTHREYQFFEMSLQYKVIP